LKGYRRIFTRFEKLDVMFLAFIHFVLIVDCLILSVNTPYKNYRASAPVLSAWSDRNGDGRVQPDEVTMRRVPGGVGTVYVTPELAFVTTQSDTLSPQGVTPDGVPLYDAATTRRTVTDAITLPTPGQDPLTTPDGWHIITSGPVNGV
jgi:hypothetical protein